MFYMAPKRRAVLLSFCLAACPLYAQMHDSAETITGRPTSSQQNHRSVSQEPVPRQTQSQTPGPDPEIDTEEIRLNPAAANGQNDATAVLEDPGFAEPDQAAIAKDYLQGIIDGKKATRGKPFWIIAGLSGTGLCICFSVAGIGLALAVPYYPSPSGENFIGKSSNYIEGYYEGYSTRIRWKNAAWATIGCLLAVLLDIALHYPLTFGNIHVDMEKNPL